MHDFVSFSEASELTILVFSNDVIAVDPLLHTYILVTALEITYDGMLHGVQRIPQTGLVMMAIFIIFLKDNCVR